MNEVVAIVFGIAGVLLLISFLPPLAHRFRLPDTVLLAALGVVLGIGMHVGHTFSNDGAAGFVVDFLHSLDDLEITSHLFLAVFLPILLFETSIKLDTRALLDDLGPILTLAVVAVVVTTVMAGASVWLVSSYTLVACMLVAAIIATTDPVAVVAVFREVGAPRRLTTLVEGESLLNDAAAIALFGLLLQLLVGRYAPDFTGLALSFLWDFVGGAAFGALAARLAGFTIGRLDDGGVAEVTLSVALSYLVYAVAESYLGTSGVVAVVVAGLVYGSQARMHLSAERWQTLVAIWNQIAFWAASLIFVLASMLVPATLIDAGWHDMMLLAALIIGALVARALVLFGILPLFRLVKPSSRVAPSYKLVMLWGGLRGAVTLALALGVRDDPAIGSDVTHLVTVLATTFVLFTLLVQATTLRGLIHWLGIDQLSPGERLLRERALDLAQAEILERLRKAATAYEIDLDHAAEVAELRGKQQSAGTSSPSDEMLREQLVTALIAVSQREVEIYVDLLSSRMVARRPGQRVIAEAQSLLDALRSEGLQGYRNAAKSHLRFDRPTRIATFLQRRLRIQRPLELRLASRFEMMLVRREAIEELQEFIAQRIRIVFGERVTETAAKMLETRLLEVERSLEALKLQYPDYWRLLTARHLSRVALRLERDVVHRMAAEGLLSAEIERDLRREISAKEHAFAEVPRLDLGLDVASLVRSMPILASFGEETVPEISALLTPRLVLPGERVVRSGRLGGEMYFIASGAVEVILDKQRVRLGTGEFFGELGLLTRQPRTADVVALGYCQLLVLTREGFIAFLRAHPELVEEVQRIASARMGREIMLEF